MEGGIVVYVINICLFFLPTFFRSLHILFLHFLSGKAAGNDKRLLKQLEIKFAKESIESGSEDLDLSSTSIISTTSSTSPQSSQNNVLSNGINLKTFYFLISTMNNMFPDYDFSEIPSEVFLKIKSLTSLMNNLNTSIFNTGIDRNTTTFADFTRKMWNCMDDAVGGLEESEIFSFNPEPFEIDDPFRDRGTM